MNQFIDKLKVLYYSNGFVRLFLALPVSLRHMALNFRRKSAFDALERLKNFARGDIVLHVSEFKGDFQLAPSSHLLTRVLVDGEYEPELAALTWCHIDPQRDFIDVGANVGFYSVLAGQALPNRRVLAIEPSAAAHTRLLVNLERNHVRERCIVFNGLAGSSNAERDLQIIEGLEEYSSVSTLKHFAIEGREARVERVPQSTIDSLVEQHHLAPGFIKIDVEGFEMEVLKGASETLRIHRPVVLCEVSDELLAQSGSSSGELFKYLKSFGYRLSDPLMPALAPGKRGYGDVLAIPEGSLSSVPTL